MTFWVYISKFILKHCIFMFWISKFFSHLFPQDVAIFLWHCDWENGVSYWASTVSGLYQWDMCLLQDLAGHGDIHHFLLYVFNFECQWTAAVVFCFYSWQHTMYSLNEFQLQCLSNWNLIFIFHKMPMFLHNSLSLEHFMA